MPRISLYRLTSLFGLRRAARILRGRVSRPTEFERARVASEANIGKSVPIIVSILLTAGASLANAQATPPGVAVGPWRTGVAVTCPDGRTIPANTEISGPDVTPAELCGLKSAAGASGTPSAGGAKISNTGNLQQDLLTNGTNLYIAAHTTNPIVSNFMQSAATSFISSMFANNAEAQRQQALLNQEIARRQQEQELARRIAEQRRIDAMFARLSSELKLEGLPFSLSLKGMSSLNPDSLPLKGMSSSGPGDLKLKISDASPSAYGIKGLPGVYVGGPASGGTVPTDASASAIASPATAASNSSLVSGPGTGTTGPGIPGLPGIYLDGVQPSQALQMAQAAETLSGPERTMAEDTALRAAQENPALTAASQDSNVQNFQQANQQYQQALAANGAASQELQTAQAHVDADKSALDVARAQLSAVTPSAEQQQAFNQMIAAAKSDDEASMLARQNFDSTEIHLSTTRERAATALASLTPSAGSANDTSTVDLRRTSGTQPNLLRAPSAPTTIASRLPAPTVAASVALPFAPRSTVSQLCAQLNGAEDALRRLLETQKMHNEDREKWEEAVNEASDDAWKRGFDMLREYSGEKLAEHLQDMIKDSDGEIEKLYREISDEKDPAKVGALQQKWEQLDRRKAYLQDAVRRAAIDQKHLDELTDERELHEWQGKYKGDLEGTMDGLRQIVDIGLGDKGVQEFFQLSPASAAFLKYGLSIEDSAFDILNEVYGAQQIKQLNQNSEEFLKAVRTLNTQIHKTVAQLNTYKAHNPEGVSCPATGSSTKASARRPD